MPNDIPMLRAAGTGYAVANAHPAARAAARHVLPSNDEDGVGQLLEALLATAESEGVRHAGHNGDPGRATGRAGCEPRGRAVTADVPDPERHSRGAGRGLGAFGPPLLLLAVMWGLELIDAVLRGTLDDAGIAARDADGLVGILAAPFLHGGFGHLLANTLPLLVLGTLVALHGRATFWRVTALVVLLGGFGTWLDLVPGIRHDRRQRPRVRLPRVSADRRAAHRLLARPAHRRHRATAVRRAA